MLRSSLSCSPVRPFHFGSGSGSNSLFRRLSSALPSAAPAACASLCRRSCCCSFDQRLPPSFLRFFDLLPLPAFLLTRCEAGRSHSAVLPPYTQGIIISSRNACCHATVWHASALKQSATRGRRQRRWQRRVAPAERRSLVLSLLQQLLLWQPVRSSIQELACPAPLRSTLFPCITCPVDRVS